MVYILLGARGARQPITLVIFAKSGGALLDNALATSVINKKFRKETFAFLLVLLFIPRRLEQLNTEGRHGSPEPYASSWLRNPAFCDHFAMFPRSEIANVLSRSTLGLF